MFMELSSRLTVIARVHPVHAMNVEQCQRAADPWTKPTDLSHKPTCKWLGTTSTIAMYYLSPLSPIHTADAGGVYMNLRRLPTDSAMRTHNAAVTQFTTDDGCVHTDDTTKLSPTSCEFVYTPPTRRDSTVLSRRRCVLGIS